MSARRQRLVQARQAPVALVAARGDALLVDGAADGASRFLEMTAIVEAAMATFGLDFDEAAQRPYLIAYSAESMTNWGDGFIVLKESRVLTRCG